MVSIKDIFDFRRFLFETSNSCTALNSSVAIIKGDFAVGELECYSTAWTRIMNG